MQSIEEVESIGINAVRQLRRTRLRRGDFFMINLNSLPPDHCYLEYPGGSIKLVVYEAQTKIFSVVRELEVDESTNLRKKFNLELIH